MSIQITHRSMFELNLGLHASDASAASPLGGLMKLDWMACGQAIYNIHGTWQTDRPSPCLELGGSISQCINICLTQLPRFVGWFFSVVVVRWFWIVWTQLSGGGVNEVQVLEGGLPVNHFQLQVTIRWFRGYGLWIACHHRLVITCINPPINGTTKTDSSELRLNTGGSDLFPWVMDPLLDTHIATTIIRLSRTFVVKSLLLSELRHVVNEGQRCLRSL